MMIKKGPETIDQEKNSFLGKKKEEGLFRLVSSFSPQGDQPQAIAKLTQGVREGLKNQVLMGVTGSGKTYTMAQVVSHIQKPTLVLAHNKTLASQLYEEMRAFFPHNAVEYFVSYYDYYQPEAYVPKTDTFIEKESTINEQIDRMRHSATRALMERQDVIIVASVSCIYGIGSVESYSEMIMSLRRGESYNMGELKSQLVNLSYRRNEVDFSRGCFRIKGDVWEIFPSHLEDRAWRLSFFGDELESIYEIDALTGDKIASLDDVTIYPRSHYVTPRPTLNQAIAGIKRDLQTRILEFEAQGKLFEAQRIRERTTFDIEMLEAAGMCPGIENYSRYLTGRAPGEPPPTLFEYFPKDALLIVDESHVSIPQLRGMYHGDRSRKENLSNFGFRLPACLDNRPLKFEEWDRMRPQTLFVSATPGPWEIGHVGSDIVEQVIRPTGLLDPICIIKPTQYQVDDLMREAKSTIEKGHRILVTTLTKKMAEALTEYLIEADFKVKYIHSDVDTLERIEIIDSLRRGEVDILIGINLLREGLDIPECGLVAIMDADKEGFLRSKQALIQTIGRAARNTEGRVILYADKITASMEYALGETNRRREIQEAYNTLHGIRPSSTQRALRDGKIERVTKDEGRFPVQKLKGKDLIKEIGRVEKEMKKAAENLDFETALALRTRLRSLEAEELRLRENTLD